MKNKTIVSLIAVSFLLTACPGKDADQSQLSAIQNNNMDLPDLRTAYYKGVQFKLSSLFENYYYDYFAYHDDADVRVINELSIYFAVEEFTTEEAIAAQYKFENDVDLLNAVHDMYAARRIKTLLDDASVSIKKELPQSVKFPGYVQVISGTHIESVDDNSYFLATLEIHGRYFVFQMIGKKDSMAYIYDDFLDLLSSVNR